MQPVVLDVKFTDNSAIVIQGYVFYENSSVPVKDAMFSIDGQVVTAMDSRSKPQRMASSPSAFRQEYTR